MMGFAASPYTSNKMELIVEEVFQGNRLEKGLDEDETELNQF